MPLMITSFKDIVSKAMQWKWTRIILGGASACALLLNATYVKSPLFGLPVSLLIFYISSRAIADLFFPREEMFVREILGFAVFISIASLIGTTLILTTMYKEMFPLLGIIALELILCLVSAIKKHSKNSSNPNQPKQFEIKDIGNLKPIILLVLYIVSLVLSFYMLLISRTGEGEISVWLNIPSGFLVIFFVSSLILVSLLLFTNLNSGLKLGLLSLHSLLSHSLFLIVWYPGRYGDPWSYLAEMRYIDKTGTIYAYEHLLKNFYVSDLVKYQAQYSLVLLFKRMFSLDIYWVHVVLIPFMWSLLTPVLLYRTANLLTHKKSPTFPLLTAMAASLFSPLVYWGAVAHANSLGFIFLLFSVVSLLGWFDSGSPSFWLISLVASLATLVAHPQPGIFALVFLFAATILKTNLHMILKAVSYASLFFVYPILLYSHKATFIILKLANLENLLSFLSQLSTPIFVLVVIGFLFSFRNKHINQRNIAFLFLFYVTVVASYYFNAYGMANLAFRPERVIVIADILSVPFVALGLLTTASILNRAFSFRKRNPLKKKKSFLLGILMICLFVSLQAALSVYSAYPRSEISSVQPSWYEMEAIYYINSTTQRYVVLSEPGFTSLAIGLLGSDYAYRGGYGFFGVPEWWSWTVELWLSMVRSPSIEVMAEGLRRSGAEIVYFVVSVRSHGFEGFDFEDIIDQTSQILPVDQIFGNGKLYVFRYSTQSMHGVGPSVKVVFDNGASVENVTSEFEYSVSTNVRYSVTLSGHYHYNVTEFPEHWTFLAVYVNGEPFGFDNSSNINNFIYVSELAAQDVLEVVWQANNLFPNAGWKEDSFKDGWAKNPFSPGTIDPSVSTDGNVLQISWNFTTGKRDYYHHAKPVNVSTDDFPNILVRWRSSGPVTEVQVSYADNEYTKYPVVPYGSQSSSWTVTAVELQPGKTLAYIEVGITSYKDPVAAAGLQTVYYDYILVCTQQ